MMTEYLHKIFNRFRFFATVLYILNINKNKMYLPEFSDLVFEPCFLTRQLKKECVLFRRLHSEY